MTPYKPVLQVQNSTHEMEGFTSYNKKNTVENEINFTDTPTKNAHPYISYFGNQA